MTLLLGTPPGEKERVIGAMTTRVGSSRLPRVKGWNSALMGSVIIVPLAGHTTGRLDQGVLKNQACNNSCKRWIKSLSAWVLFATFKRVNAPCQALAIKLARLRQSSS